MSPQDASTGPVQRPRVLVVEDEEGIRKFVKRVLEEDYDVRFAANGQEGLQQARAVRPDIILLDLRMPVLDGLSVLAQLKASQETSAIPVVVVSVQGETDMLLECQRAGAVDHVIKPFNVDDLRKVVQRQISTRRT
jgi:CheY-like chemotaxis protein